MNDTWTHAAARVVVRPLIGLGVRPNHLTSLRLASGLLACALLSLGTRGGDVWGGFWWVVSAFLDRADGELARIGQMQSRRGHLFDYYSDVLVNSLFFLAIGFGQRHSFLRDWSFALGGIAFVAMLLCSWLSEVYEDLNGPGVRIFAGGFGFHFDDALYLLGPFAWLGWLAPILVGASIGASGFALVIIARLLGLMRRRRREAHPA